MKQVLLLETSVTGTGARLFESARRLGVKLLFFFQDRKKYARLGLEHFADTFEGFEVDTQDKSAMLECLRARGRGRVDGIVCLTDRCIEKAAELAECLGLPFIPSEGARTFRNKDETARLARKLGLRVPKDAVIYDEKDAREQARALGYPIVLKSSRGFGSAEVSLCRDEAELTRELSGLFERARSAKGRLLLQEYVLGPVVSVEAITHAGTTRVLGLSDRIMGPVPRFVEVGDTFPVDWGTQNEAELTRRVEQLLAAEGVRYALSHTEFILAREGPVLIELNPRLSGGLVGEMIGRAYGIDFFDEILRAGLGMEPVVPSRPVLALTEYFLYPSQRGRLRELRGLEIAAACPGILSARAYARVGDTVAPAIDYASQALVGILSEGETPGLSLARCLAALSNIETGYEGG